MATGLHVYVSPTFPSSSNIANFGAPVLGGTLEAPAYVGINAFNTLQEAIAAYNPSAYDDIRVLASSRSSETQDQGGATIAINQDVTLVAGTIAPSPGSGTASGHFIGLAPGNRVEFTNALIHISAGANLTLNTPAPQYPPVTVTTPTDSTAVTTDYVMIDRFGSTPAKGTRLNDAIDLLEPGASHVLFVLGPLTSLAATQGQYVNDGGNVHINKTFTLTGLSTPFLTNPTTPQATISNAADLNGLSPNTTGSFHATTVIISSPTTVGAAGPPTLQDAVDLAASGGTVKIDGTFNQDVNVYKPLTVTQASPGVIGGTLVVNSSNVTVSNLTFNQVYGNASSLHVSAGLNNVVISGNTFSGNGTSTDILIDNTAAPFVSSGSSISGNTFTSTGLAAGVNGSIVTGTSGYAVTGNTFSAAFPSAGNYKYFDSSQAPAASPYNIASIVTGSGNTFLRSVYVETAPATYTQAVFTNINPTIALGTTTPGSTLHVGAGVYAENVGVSKFVKIVGAGSGNNPLADSIVNAGGAGGDVFRIYASGASAANPLLLQNLRVTGGSANGVVLLDDTPGKTISNVTLDNLSVTGNAANGILANDSGDDGFTLNNIVVTGNAVRNNGGSGIYIDPTLDNVTGFKVLGSIVQTNNSYGLYIGGGDGGGAGGQVRDQILLQGDQFINNGGAGGYTPTFLADVTLNGVRGAVTLNGVTINDTNKVPYGLALGAGDFFTGPAIPSFGTVSLTNVVITGNQGTDPLQPAKTGGALLIGDGSKLQNISFSGVQLNSTTPNGLLLYATPATSLPTEGPLNLGNTLIAGTATTFIRQYDVGSPSVTDGKADVTATNVTFDSFNNLTDAFTIQGRLYHKPNPVNTGLITFLANTVLVPIGSGIQPAIDAAPSGGIVLVQAGGTYAGGDVVWKPLTIQASTGPRPIVISDVYNTRPGSFAGNGAFQISSLGGGSTITGFDLREPASPAPPLASDFGVALYAPGTVSNNLITGYFYGVSPASGVNGITVTGNSILSSRDTGIILGSGNGNTVSNNTITNSVNAGVDAIGQTNLVFTGNVISNSAAPASPSTSPTGLILDTGTTGTGTATFTGNAFSNLNYNVRNMTPNSFNFQTGNTFDGVSPAVATLPQLFAIEDKMFHGPDNGTSGIVYVVANNVYVTTPAASPTVGNPNNETINNAVTTANPGNVVNVADGTFNEDVLITKYLTLLSANGSGSTTINGVSTGYTGAVKVAANVGNTSPAQPVVIGAPGKGFTINGAGQAAVYLSQGDKNVTVDSNVIKSAAAKNALLTEGGQTSHTIKNNTFTAVAAGAGQLVYVNGTASVAIASTGVNFTGNTFSGKATGVLLGQEAASSTISNNTFTGDVDSGVAVDLFGTSATITGNTITNGFATPKSGTGIYVEAPSNTIGTTIGGVGAGVSNTISNFATGILVAGKATIAGNTTTISGNAIGIDVNGAGATANINNNVINNNNTGIRFINGGTTGSGAGTGPVASINFNGASAATNNGVDLNIAGTAGTVAIGASNQFAGNQGAGGGGSGGGFITNTSTQNFALPATTTFNLGSGNLSAAGATLSQLFSIEDRILHKVDVNTYGLVRVSPGQVYVTPNSFSTAGGTTTASIQRGINSVGVNEGAAPFNDTVWVQPTTAPATYTEDGVTITGSALSNTTLRGGGGVATLDPATAGAGTGLTVSGGANNVKVIDFILEKFKTFGLQANSVNGLQLTNVTSRQNDGDGVYATGVNGLTLNGVQSQANTNSNPLSFPNLGNGVVFNNSTNLTATNGTLVDGNFAAGLLVNGGSSNVTVNAGGATGNSFSGNQRGIVLDASSASLSNITLDDSINIFSNAIAGIRAATSAGTTITGLNIGQASLPATSPVVISGNGSFGMEIRGRVNGANVNASFVRGGPGGVGILDTGLDNLGTNSPTNLSVKSSSFSGYNVGTFAITLLDSTGSATNGWLSSNDVDATGAVGLVFFPSAGNNVYDKRVDARLGLVNIPVAGVTGISVQDGAIQRSYIDHVDLSFSDPSSAATLVANPARVQVVKYSKTGAAIGLLNPATDFTLSVSSGNRLRVSFPAGKGPNFGNFTTGDGIYQVQCDLTGSSVYATGARFYRLLGDVNGDQTTNFADVNLITAGIPAAYNPQYDTNGDGVVNIQDRVNALNNLFAIVTGRSALCRTPDPRGRFPRRGEGGSDLPPT
ncbi:MAG: right-handed parallel beta-helix repeat-containing protein [Isosphaeraceae bacterium]